MVLYCVNQLDMGRLRIVVIVATTLLYVALPATPPVYPQVSAYIRTTTLSALGNRCGGLDLGRRFCVVKVAVTLHGTSNDGAWWGNLSLLTNHTLITDCDLCWEQHHCPLLCTL